ncbi:MAG: FAD:protein FMN transferase, partial [Deltaproteobacteria bacterium]|nr:FAD:protein FMN transferase [Deltaproteobacteria bacterium]
MGLGSSLASCGDRAAEDAGAATPVAPETASPATGEHDELRYISLSRPLMGTIFRINVVSTPEVAEPAIRAAFAEIARLEDVLSEWREDSAISNINRNAGREPVVVGPDVLAVIKA